MDKSRGNAVQPRDAKGRFGSKDRADAGSGAKRGGAKSSGKMGVGGRGAAK